MVFAIFDCADVLLSLSLDSFQGLLSLSKIMQYAWLVIPGYICFALFTSMPFFSLHYIFLVLWIYTRHYLVIVVMVSIATQAQKYLPIIWDPARGYFVSRTWSKPVFLTLFGLLELLQIMWLK